MPSQPMRSKQLLMSHGPGSILETVNGPVVIKGFSSLTTPLEVWKTEKLDFRTTSE